MRLTLPAAEPGMRFILAGGRKVGWVIDIWDDGPGHQAWEAHLWGGPGLAPKGHKTVVRKRLADLREDLRVLAEKEPWWTA